MQEFIQTIADNKDFPILFQDAKIIMRIEEYDKYNINLLKRKNIYHL